MVEAAALPACPRAAPSLGLDASLILLGSPAATCGRFFCFLDVKITAQEQLKSDRVWPAEQHSQGARSGCLTPQSMQFVLWAVWVGRGTWRRGRVRAAHKPRGCRSPSGSVPVWGGGPGPPSWGPTEPDRWAVGGKQLLGK